MRIHKKAAAGLSLAAAMALVLAGCSGKSSDDKKTEAPNEPATTAQAGTEDPAENPSEDPSEDPSEEPSDDPSQDPAAIGDPANPVTITYLHRLPDGPEMVKVAESFERFNNEHPGVKVETMKFDGAASDSYAKIHSMVEAKEGLCLAQVGYGEIASEFVAGDLLDISEFVGPYEGHYAAGPMGQMKAGNAVVGLPQDTGPLVYMYDTKAFAELGISAPTNWDEFTEAARTARAAGKYIGTFQMDEAQYLMSGQAAAAGAKWFSVEDAKWKVDLKDEATTKVAEIYQNLIDEDLILVVNRWGDEFKNGLIDGTIIGTVGAGWEPAFFLNDIKEETTGWEVTQLPAFDPANPATGADGGSGIAVIQGCANPEIALYVADWYNTQVPDLVSQGLVVAANTEAPVTPEAIQKKWNGQDVFKVLMEANAIMNGDFPYLPTWPAVGAEMKATAGTVKKGGTPVADVFNRAAEIAVQSLKDKGLPVAE